MPKRSHYGTVDIVTDQPYAIPGEDVRGKIYVHLNKEFPANKVMLKIEGKEKCKWYEMKVRMVEENGQQKFETYEVKHDKKKEFLDMEVLVHHFQGADIPPGDYIFEFIIQLPPNSPSSTYYTGDKKSEAFVKYKLKAKFKSDSFFTDDLKDETFLVVRELADGVNMNLNATETVNVKKFLCCCSIGTCVINTWFERNVYTTDEMAQAIVSVDNERCSGRAKIVMQLKQKVHLDAGIHDYRRTNIVLKQEFGFVEPRQKIENKPVNLNLALIRPDLHYENKSVDSDIDDLQDQARAMAESIQPTTTGKCLSIRYELETLIDFEGVCCPIDEPNCIIDLFLQPPYLPNQVQFVPPPQWSPQVFQPPPPIIIIVQNEGGESESIVSEDSKVLPLESDNTFSKMKKDSYEDYEEEKVCDEDQ